MLRIRKILVPTDFSERSSVAARHAGAMAEVFGAEILVLHVVETQYDYLFDCQDYGLSAGPVPPNQDDLKNAVESRLAAVQKDCGAGARTHQCMREGTPYWEIIEVAKQQSADMIVIATHGRTGMERLLLGSVAERVVRLAPCLVLTVRDGQRRVLD